MYYTVNVYFQFIPPNPPALFKEQVSLFSLVPCSRIAEVFFGKIRYSYTKARSWLSVVVVMGPHFLYFYGVKTSLVYVYRVSLGKNLRKISM